MPLLAGEWSHSSPQWRALGRGLSFAEIQVFRQNEPVDTLAVVKVDPASNAFRVQHHKPQSITAWQKELGAPVVFNASYYSKDNQPCGLILSNGNPMGPRRNTQMRGMFVAEPKGLSPDIPRATILDLTITPISVKTLPWTQGVQSYPLLLDYKGRIRVWNSPKTAQRTVIAIDRHSYIMIFNTNEAYFTLYDFAHFLKASTLEIDSALNLDGGTEAQLYIKTQDFEKISPSSWESRLGNLLDQHKFWLPTVVGVFPRQD
ncbi:MAG: phosphodiester glycosidase family protein [Deltaproteobacteria bacterium]|nr:phosphodiester glycosidase family protein [Deltaproteobacteria bacterium]